jgi:hypothetical protein
MSRASVIRELQGRHYEEWRRKRGFSSPRSPILETARRQLARQKYFESLTFCLWGMGLDMTAEEIRRNHYRMETDDLRRERIGKRTLGELLSHRQQQTKCRTSLLSEIELLEVRLQPPSESGSSLQQNVNACCFGSGSYSVH